MPPSISAALLMLLLVGGWFLARRRVRPFLRSTDTTVVAELHRGQIERLQVRLPSSEPRPVPSPAPTSAPIEAAAGSIPEVGPEACPAALPPGGRERRLRLAQLQAWMTGSREQRLQALTIARQSSRRDVLPLLRLGLRDPDPAVMAAAAAAMVRFRGRSRADSQETSARAAGLGSLAQVQPGRAAGAAPLSGTGALWRPRSVLRTR